eukprot:13843590-Alexandrium_andersonii.AAC.1
MGRCPNRDSAVTFRAKVRGSTEGEANDRDRCCESPSARADPTANPLAAHALAFGTVITRSTCTKTWACLGCSLSPSGPGPPIDGQPRVYITK